MSPKQEPINDRDRELCQRMMEFMENQQDMVSVPAAGRACNIHPDDAMRILLKLEEMDLIDAHPCPDCNGSGL